MASWFYWFTVPQGVTNFRLALSPSKVIDIPLSDNDEPCALIGWHEEVPSMRFGFESDVFEIYRGSDMVTEPYYGRPSF